MEQYSLERELTSCSIDKTLITELEKYLTERVKSKLSSVMSLDDSTRIDYSLSIIDSVGEESLNSVNDFHREKFSNNTESICLRYTIDIYKAQIFIKFGKRSANTFTTVELQCPGAKELALGISREIENIIDDKKTIHFIFYRPSYLLPVFASPSLSLLYAFFGLPKKEVALLVTAILVTVYFLLIFLTPYSTFDTRRNERRESAISWVLKGCLGVVIFGSFAGAIKTLTS